MADVPAVMHLRDRGSQLALRAAVLTAWGKVNAGAAIREVVLEVLASRRHTGFKHAPAEFAGKLRDIFGNPFRPVSVEPSWLTSTVVALAEGIYQEKAFDRLPILADALMDAGCDNDDVLNHCRDPHATHVRGCWVVDSVLGKE
jgi:hypothetical protein